MRNIDKNSQNKSVYEVRRYEYNDISWILDFFADIKLCKKNKTEYFNVAAAFDIETTNIPYVKNEKTGDFEIVKEYYDKTIDEYKNIPIAFMYSWQVAFKNKNIEIMIRGRKWEEYLKFMELLKDVLDLSQNRYLVFYVHNLSFEFQYFYWFHEWKKIFAREPRKIMKCTTSDGLEFRCSYFLSNMNLAKFIKNCEGTEHGKMNGDLDYKVYRDYDTPLTTEEIGYIENDVLGLVEAIDSKLLDDTIITIPITSTGYVRRDVRENCFNVKGYGKNLKKGWPSPEVYTMCKDAFRGGNTHANRAHAGKALKNVYSFDIKSSYPAWMLYEDYPCGQASEFLIDTLDRFIEIKEKKLMIMEVEFFDLELMEEKPVPYLDTGHLRMRQGVEEDNGRVLYANYVRFTCTSIDFDIITGMYKYSGFTVLTCYGWNKKKLPYPIREKSYGLF